MNHRQRRAYSVAAIFGLLFLISQVTLALAQNYSLTSLTSTNSALPSLPAFQPSINNSGKVAYARRVFDPGPNFQDFIIFIHDGVTETPFFNVTDATGGGGLNANLVINDNDAVAALVNGSTGDFCPGNPISCLIRINANQTVTILATANGVGGGADFAEIAPPSMNSSGQVAVKVRRTSDGTDQIVRIDGPGAFTEIATQTAPLILTSQPSINDSGTVAFAAEVPNTPACPGPSSCVMVFSGIGGALTSEGRRPPSGNSGFAPFINENGLVLDTAVATPALIYTAQGGVVNVLVVGNEDPAFTTIAHQPSHNDFGDFVFGSNSGLFAGNDPSEDTIVRISDNVFGGTVVEIRTALHYINNLGQIVFAMTEVDGSQNATTHIVLAEVPDITVTPTSLDFGAIALGKTSANQTMTVRNDGTATLSLGAISVGGANANQFSKAADNCSKKNLEPAASCTVGARFSPTSNGAKTGTLIIPSNDPDENPFNVALSGTGGAGSGTPEVTVTPLSINFGNVIVKTAVEQTITVTNDGTANLIIAAISLGGTNADQFAKASDKCSKKTLTPGGSCTVAARFKPTSNGAKTATLIIPSNDPDENPVNVTLSGSGGTGGGGGSPDITVTPLALDFGSIAVGNKSVDKIVSVKNDGAANLTISAITLGGANANQFVKASDSCSKKTLAPGVSCSVAARFKPTSSGIKTGNLTIPSNDPDENPVSVSLSGTGTP